MTNAYEFISKEEIEAADKNWQKCPMCEPYPELPAGYIFNANQICHCFQCNIEFDRINHGPWSHPVSEAGNGVTLSTFSDPHKHRFIGRKNDYAECIRCGLRVKQGVPSFAAYRDTKCPNK